jgi:hypothetical protein
MKLQRCRMIMSVLVWSTAAYDCCDQTPEQALREPTAVTDVVFSSSVHLLVTEVVPADESLSSLEVTSKPSLPNRMSKKRTSTQLSRTPALMSTSIAVR